MSMFSSSLDEAKLDPQWKFVPSFRIMTYRKFLSNTPLLPQNAADFGTTLLTFYKGEEDLSVKKGLIDFLNDNMRTFQENGETPRFDDLYRKMTRLIYQVIRPRNSFEANLEANTLKTSLITSGLKIANRESTASSQGFFQSAMGYIAMNAGERAWEVPAEEFTPLLEAADALAHKHPSVISPEYIAACCKLMQHKTYLPANNQVSEAVEEENDNLQRMSVHAGENLLGLTRDLINHPAVAFSADELFPDDVRTTLTRLSKSDSSEIKGIVSAILDCLQEQGQAPHPPKFDATTAAQLAKIFASSNTP